ncbi:MAG: GDP-L-fucose synthase family protein [Candidatus Nanopelagicales bacterium]
MKDQKIFVAGSTGLVGSALVRTLAHQGFQNLLTPTRKDLDLTNRREVFEWFNVNKPDVVFLAAARVGGIGANSTYPAEFISENLQIQVNTLDAAAHTRTSKLLFLGSSCIYPANAPQPMKEEYLLTGALEQTNHAYAMAKLAGIEQVKSIREQYGLPYISVLPTNLYGPNDNFDLNTSHVIPAMVHKFHNAKVNGESTVELWGDGSPLREFMYVDDLAEACIFLLDKYNSSEPINIGTGEEVSIQHLASLIQDTIGFKGEVIWNTDKPNGVKRKLLDNSLLQNLGFTPLTKLKDGLLKTYSWFSSQQT